MDLFIAWDGDHIGRQVGQLALDDDEEGLRRVSQAIEHGNQVWASWVQERMGALISYGGDEGRARLPADALGELERIRGLYSTAVGATVSVGVGLRLSEADKALLVAKLRGGDKILLWTPELSEDLEQLEDRSEAEKLQDEYMSKAEEDPVRPAFQHKATGEVIEVPGAFHDLMHLPADADPNEYEEGFVDERGNFYNREQAKAHTQPRSMYLAKASPPGSPPESPESPATAEPASPAGGGGFTEGGSAPGAEMGSPGSAFAEGSEHSQGEAMRSMADDTSHASSSMEDELHGHAKEQDDQDKADAAAQDKQQDARQKVVEILKEVQQIAPQLEQAKEQMPELYQAFGGMVQALLITAQATLGGDDQGAPPPGGDDGSASPPEKSESSDTKKSEPDRFSKLRAYLDGPAGETKPKLKALLTKLMLKKGWPKDEAENAANTAAHQGLHGSHAIARDLAQEQPTAVQPVSMHGEPVKGVEFPGLRPTLPLVQHKFKGVGNDPLPDTPALPKTVTTITGRDVVLPENQQIGDNKHLQLVPGAETQAGYTRAAAIEADQSRARPFDAPNTSFRARGMPVQTQTFPNDSSPEAKARQQAASGQPAPPGSQMTPLESGWSAGPGNQNYTWNDVAYDAFTAANPIPVFNRRAAVVGPLTPAPHTAVSGEMYPDLHFVFEPPKAGGGGGVHPTQAQIRSYYGNTQGQPVFPLRHANWSYDRQGNVTGQGFYENIPPQEQVAAQQHLQDWLRSPAGMQAQQQWETFHQHTPNPPTTPQPIPTEKAEAPATGKPHIVLPVGAVKDGQVKVQHTEDGQAGKTGWVSARAGQVLSNDGHPISSRNPGGK